MAVAQAVGILALPREHLEELVPEILGVVVVLQNLLAMEAAALQNQDASAVGNPLVGVGVSHTGAAGVAETQPGVEVLQGVLAEAVQAVVDAAASVVDVEVAVHLPLGPPFGAVEAHAESHPSGLGREFPPFPFAYPVAADLVGLLGIRQVLMVGAVRRVQLGGAKHPQLDLWVRKVEREVAGE